MSVQDDSLQIHVQKNKKVPSVLDHITDVGAGQFEGVDSTYRIRQQYQNVNVQNPNIISAGHSPMHVAFTGTTCLSVKARKNANYLLNILFDIKQKKRLPIALNSAPRNSDTEEEDGKEDHIFWVKTEGRYADYLVYGLQVVEWVKVFHKVESVSKILSINEIIKDTADGSQFRSAEHLPLVHILAAMSALEEHATIQEIELKKIHDRYPYPNDIVVAPCDEYGNGRLILDRSTMEKVIAAGKCTINGLINVPLHAKTSLTKVVPGELSVWPSSNHFPNPELAVLNIGTRWAEGTTRLTDAQVKDTGKILTDNIGQRFSIDF